MVLYKTQEWIGMYGLQTQVWLELDWDVRHYIRHRYGSGLIIRSIYDFKVTMKHYVKQKHKRISQVSKAINIITYPDFFIFAGCYLFEGDQARITLAAYSASAQSQLVSFGYKISPIGKVCYINGNDNIIVRSSFNLYNLV